MIRPDAVVAQMVMRSLGGEHLSRPAGNHLDPAAVFAGGWEGVVCCTHECGVIHLVPYDAALELSAASSMMAALLLSR